MKQVNVIFGDDEWRYFERAREAVGKDMADRALVAAAVQDTMRRIPAEQLLGVVVRGRKLLQRCYETALRGVGSEQTVRLDVDIEVSPPGRVTSVRTNGDALPGMDLCVMRTVKAWHFPRSDGGAQTRFPVIFQPGG